MFGPRRLIAVGLYELVFSPLLLAVTPTDARFLRWVLAAGLALGLLAVGYGVWWLRDERGER